MGVIPLDPVTERDARRTLPILVPTVAEQACTVSQRVAYLLSQDHASLPGAETILMELQRQLPGTIQAAFVAEDPEALLELHKALFVLYEVRFLHPLAPAVVHEHRPWLLHVRQMIEDA